MSYYDVVGEETASDNVANTGQTSTAAASNRDVPIASVSSHNPAAKPKKPSSSRSSNRPR